MKLRNNYCLDTALVLSGVVFFSIFSFAQDREPAKQNARRSETQVEAVTPVSSARPASYSYEFKQPAFYIKHVTIRHDEKGAGEMTFEKLDGGDPISEPIQLSPGVLAKITGYFETLHFLDSETNYQSDKQFPHLGTMWIRMSQNPKSRTAEFNWTNDKVMAALVEEYRRVENQAMFVFDISLARVNQPLEAPKVMDGLDSLLSRNEISDPMQLAPLLEDLVNDEHIPLIARNHATRLLKKIRK